MTVALFPIKETQNSVTASNTDIIDPSVGGERSRTIDKLHVAPATGQLGMIN